MRRAKLLWKGSGSWEFQALLVSGWSSREKFWKFDFKKIGGAMNILGARVKRVFPPSLPVFLDGRPGRLLDWSIDPSVLLNYCFFHLMQCSLLFFSIVLIGRAHTTWRTLEGSEASLRIPGSLKFSILSFSHTPHKSGTQGNIFFSDRVLWINESQCALLTRRSTTTTTRIKSGSDR